MNGVLEYKWSRIIRPGHVSDDTTLVWDCRIDTAQKKKAAEDSADDGPEWEFLFCPEQFDEEISIEQFQPQPLDMEAM